MLETSCVIVVFSLFLALVCVLEPFKPESSELRSTRYISVKLPKQSMSMSLQTRPKGVHIMSQLIGMQLTMNE